MAKSYIVGLIQSQYGGLVAKDNKERLRHLVAGIKDGKLYSHSGADYGMFDENAEDVEFITDADLALSRVTAIKIRSITNKMQTFFAGYGLGGLAGKLDDEGTDTEDVTTEEHAEVEVPPINVQAVTEAFDTALENGKLKKARKLLNKLNEAGVKTKKLEKKLKKAGK